MLPFVQFVDQLHASIKPQGVRRISGQVDDFYVIVANVPDATTTLAVLASVSRGPPDSSPFGDDQLLVRVSLDGADIERVLAEPLVIGISHVPTVALSDERVATSMTGNIDPISGAPTNPTKYKDWLASACPFCTNLQHDGFYVAMADSGLDGGVNGIHHADLPLARVRYGKNFDLVDQKDPNGTPCSASLPCQDVNGHGTMTAGIVAGNPATGSAADVDGFLFGVGVAPSAGVLFSKVDLRPTFATPVRFLATDARITANPPVYIQNHSYNQYVAAADSELASGITCDTVIHTYDGAYSIVSSLFDRSVKDADQSGTAQPITLTVSSGNQFPTFGELIQCRDLRLALPAATAKNVISVGAAESVRGPSEQWNCEAGVVAGISADSFNNIMGGSRRGTLNDHWFKPDLMAPGSNVASLRSNSWDNGHTNSLCAPPGGAAQPPPFSGGDTYLGGSGTSFAAPAAAGAALLASRIYAEHLLPACANTACDPGAASPALLKAMLVMSARSMRGGQDQAVAPWWLADHQYHIGAVVRPTHANGHFYIAANTGGRSALQEPNWLTGSGSATPDNGQDGPIWMESGSTIIGPLPNKQQGFGRIDLEDLLSSYPARDYVNNDLIAGPNTIPWTRTYQVHDSTLPVKVVLAWTDEAALANEPNDFAGTADPLHILVSDLNLTVEFGSNPCTRYIGNWTTVNDDVRGEESVGVSCQASAPDTTNNVELVKFFPSVNGATQFTVKIAATQGTNQSFALVVYNGYDVTGTAPPAKPANLVATGNAFPGVTATWSAVPGATGYEVRRRSSSSPFAILLGQQTGTTFSDPSVSGNTGYAYFVRAVNAAGVSADSVGFATTMTFTDDPIVPGVTLIKGVHVTELQLAVNAVRAALLLGPFSFTGIDSTGLVKSLYVNELRTALDQARGAVLLPHASYTDPSLTPGLTVVKSAHVTELRSGVQ
ncbi:MAG TPA: S8 family serine peptidase [Thermoanaerobaculia bacterium]|nr:S8 family serine peptidase [Thermoanaerobaculia bacterium]